MKGGCTLQITAALMVEVLGLTVVLVFLLAPLISSCSLLFCLVSLLELSTSFQELKVM